ncbi:flotillin family protein [Haliangium ochraceum]|uniref:Band 7 protein n=1 Tax=Haliangium ochraceum (strain DSM 14365 / JCM 11303 / SMP-2) TaxID=502025 RepID=D0LJ15_HALO1|nr:flotillin family protein [Haliangium ochraceum]ACY13044.1 band 7 protein [Haliangium ochraceum DSM 14365]
MFPILFLIALAAAIAIAILVWKNLEICAPNEVLIFSGKRTKYAGREIGYRLVQGGRGFRWPLIEIVDRLDLTNMIIDIRVQGAYSKGGIPLNVDAVANVKIASVEPSIGNAIERLLGKSRDHIMTVARETLEGNLRGVLATLTPEEVNQDREKFADSLLQEADHDLSRLGLELDTLKIQNVSDDRGYLDSLGRRQSAAVIMRSRIAEAENKAHAAERSAANLETQEIAKIVAEIEKARADAERRIVDAQTRKDAMVAEARGQVEAQVAKARAEVEVQQARMEQVRLQLEADYVKPAEANRQQLIAQARGESATIIERGKATAEALRRVSATWREAGDSARQIFVAQKLNALIGSLMSTVGDISVQKVTFIDESLAKGGSNFAVNAAVTAEQLKHTLGVDVPALLERVGGGNGAGATRRTPATPPPKPAQR